MPGLPSPWRCVCWVRRKNRKIPFVVFLQDHPGFKGWNRTHRVTICGNMIFSGQNPPPPIDFPPGNRSCGQAHAHQHQHRIHRAKGRRRGGRRRGKARSPSMVRSPEQEGNRQGRPTREGTLEVDIPWPRYHHLRRSIRRWPGMSVWKYPASGSVMTDHGVVKQGQSWGSTGTARDRASPPAGSRGQGTALRASNGSGERPIGAASYTQHSSQATCPPPPPPPEKKIVPSHRPNKGLSRWIVCMLHKFWRGLMLFLVPPSSRGNELLAHNALQPGIAATRSVKRI